MTILCLGSALADITVWPVDTQQLAREHVCPELTMVGPGGCAGNLSLGLAALGCPVALAARLGNDQMGDLVKDHLRQRGVKAHLLQQDDQRPTGTTIVLVDDQGERRFIYTAGANAHLDPLPLSRVDLNDFSAVQVSDIFLLHKMLDGPLLEILQNARAKGKTTSMDTVWDPSGRWMDVLKPYLPLLDYFFVSEEEGRHLLPNASRTEMVQTFQNLGAGVVVLKCGEDGCLMGHENQIRTFTPPKVRPVDSTGAGDAFVAGFLAAITEGASIENAAGVATDFAVHSLSFIGATAGFKQFDDTKAFQTSLQCQSI